MIYIEFDNESNVPEETVQKAAESARQFDVRLRRIDGLKSRRVAAQASSTAGLIAGFARKVSRISGRFADSAIEATPMRDDYRAVMRERGGMRPRDIPWLACERAILGDYCVITEKVGFQLLFDMRIPPATFTLNLHTRSDEAICPDDQDATLRVGVAEVPFPLHLPGGLRADDIAQAFEVMMPLIEKSAMELWMQSEGGTREVF